ncbi:glycosyltransferase family 2 protein [Thermobaculum terrenum]|nr:glycosyltransferase family 2 protein [Thermobaculum terrenum]
MGINRSRENSEAMLDSNLKASANINGKLSLILPARNEEANLPRVLGRCIEVLNETLPDWEIIVVNDGSQDKTGEIAEGFAARDSRIRVIHHPRNLGYGSAWRSGFAAAHGQYIMCMDSDGQFDIGDISLLLPYVNHYDIVAGYRTKRQDPAHRKVNAAIFHLAAKLLFGIHLKDIDCGFKIFRASLIKSLPLKAPGALINLEIFSFAKLRKASIIEVGVHHYPRTAGVSTGAKPSVVLQAMAEILLLRLRVWKERIKVSPLVGAGAAIGALFAVLGIATRARNRTRKERH